MVAGKKLPRAVFRTVLGWARCEGERRTKVPFKQLVAGTTAIAFFCVPSQSDPTESAVRNSFAEVGLLEMPSGRMAPDGAFGFNFGDTGNYQRYSIFFQATPWLETSYRYSKASWWQGFSVFYDRSFGAKLRLLNEQDNFADVSVGLRDIVGTGVYGAEYLAISKRFGPIDASIGMGWGRLGSSGLLSNPFGAISSSFDVRPELINTGQFNANKYFHGGKVGLFGGLQWDTPVSGLRVLTEYSSDKYVTEAAYPHGLHVRSPVNIGLSYAPTSDISITGSWMYGTTFGAIVTFTANGHSKIATAERVGPPVPSPAIRPAAEQQLALTVQQQDHRAFRKPVYVTTTSSAERTKQPLLEALLAVSHSVRDVQVEGTALVVNARVGPETNQQCARYAQIVRGQSSQIETIVLNDLERSNIPAIICRIGDTAPSRAQAEPPFAKEANALHDALSLAMDAQSIHLTGLAYRSSEVWVYYENYRYFSEAQAAGRILRLLTVKAPPTVEVFHLVPSDLGVPTRMITVTRSSLERSFAAPVPTDAPPAYWLQPAPMANPALTAAAEDRYPMLSYSLSPKLAQRLFDPDAPIEFMFYADAQALLRLAPGLNLEAEATGTLWRNYTLTRDAGSELPHVRSDILRYLDKGEYGIAALNLSYRTRLAPNVFVEARGGILEDMFAGGGGQILWRPEGSRLSFGADLYQVWQRDYNRLFGLQNYHVTTGHVSAYYDSPWYGLNFAVHAGRYLAGDDGATFEITRRFSGGVRIGAWATFTNVPFDRFGEGSFDKGIIIHIPLQWGLPIFTQSFYDLHLNSLTRDGGQRLAGDDSLYESTLDTSEGELLKHADELTTP